MNQNYAKPTASYQADPYAIASAQAKGMTIGASDPVSSTPPVLVEMRSAREIADRLSSVVGMVGERLAGVSRPQQDRGSGAAIPAPGYGIDLADEWASINRQNEHSIAALLDLLDRLGV